MDVLESGQTHGQNCHVKAEITEEIVTNPRTIQSDKLHQDLYDKEVKYYVYDNGDKPEGNSKVISQISFDSLSYLILSSPHSKDDTTKDNSCPLPYASPTIYTEKLIYSSCFSGIDIPIPPNWKQLLFLYDCETTGLSHYEEHVIEIGCLVILPDNLSVTQLEFSSLCHTSHRIDPQAYMKHGITARMLVGKPSFSMVFNRLLEWIKQCIKEASTNDLYYPVLVAHHGFPFHYYFLMSEIKRHNLEQNLKAVDLWFADTLYDVRKFRKASDPIFNDWSQREPLGLVDLFHKFFPEEPFGDPRRAMEDIQALKQVFTTTSLTPILKKLTIKTKEEIWKKWYEKWYARLISQPYIAKMGKYCSQSLAMCLHNKGITYDQLRAACVAYNSEECDMWMKGEGIKLKKWRNNIQDHFSDLDN